MYALKVREQLVGDVAYKEEVALYVDVLYHVVLHLKVNHEVAHSVDASLAHDVVSWVVAVDEFRGEVFLLNVFYLLDGFLVQHDGGGAERLYDVLLKLLYVERYIVFQQCYVLAYALYAFRHQLVV